MPENDKSWIRENGLKMFPGFIMFYASKNLLEIYKALCYVKTPRECEVEYILFTLTTVLTWSFEFFRDLK